MKTQQSRKSAAPLFAVAAIILSKGTMRLVRVDELPPAELLAELAAEKPGQGALIVALLFGREGWSPLSFSSLTGHA
jgi:hypothetical protein